MLARLSPLLASVLAASEDSGEGAIVLAGVSCHQVDRLLALAYTGQCTVPPRLSSRSSPTPSGFESRLKFRNNIQKGMVKREKENRLGGKQRSMLVFFFQHMLIGLSWPLGPG